MAAAVQLVVLQEMLLFLLSFLSYPLLNAEARETMLSPGCEFESFCGEVRIPFPFGMEEGCYLDSSYRIDCINRSVPILTINGSTSTTHLEVISISVDQESTIRVNFPIAFSSKCKGKERNYSTSTTAVVVDLEGTPFAFSSTLNYFIASGCDNLALMIQNGATVGGCMSICDKNANYSSRNYMMRSSCSGINCCQTSIPTSLKVLNVSLRGVNDDDGAAGRSEEEEEYCRYAYLVEQGWADERSAYPENAGAGALPHPTHNPAPYGHMEDREYVPAVLDWGVIKHGSLKKSTSSNCETSGPPINSTNYHNQSFTVQCSCPYGFEGNPYLGDCQATHGAAGYASSYYYQPHQSVRAKIAGIGVGVGLGTLFVLIGVWRLHKVFKRKRNERLKKKYFKRNGGLLLQEQLSSGEVNVQRIKMFSAKELDKATDRYNVNRMLGQGGQGTVYKGMLADGKIVAVKKSKILNEGNLKQFINEVVILSQINHRNVVKLLGCCLETEVPLLVYEFIPNGTLFQFIHVEPNVEITLTWEMRLRMATEVAEALSYLHSAASIPIYHRDIKSTTILLDEKYRAKVADFGTSRTITIDQTHLTTLVQGTFGYLDPEYFQSSQFTDKSDVYSFGVLLVELLTGQKPITFTKSEQEGRSLATYFLMAMETNLLFDILDPQVMKQGKKENVLMVATLAKSCLRLSGKERPTMKEVTTVLERIQKSQGNPKLTKDLNIPQPIESDRNEAIDMPWDLASTSTDSGFDIGAASLPKDTKPLLHTY